jgi:hypothetical protein
MSRLGSWEQSRPALLVAAFMLLGNVCVEFLLWAMQGSRPQPWFASVPYLYVPAALWLLYRARREPLLMQVGEGSIAGAFLIMSLGRQWQEVAAAWLAIRLLNVVTGVCVVAGGWLSARPLERLVAVSGAPLMLAWAFAPFSWRRPLAFAIIAAVLYGVIASGRLRAKQAPTPQECGAAEHLSGPQLSSKDTSVVRPRSGR